MLSRKHKLFALKFISLFSVVRGYNIPIIALAQYLSAIFILAPDQRALSILLDFRLFIIVLASSVTIASGYIINNFYDSKKDLINRPNKSHLDRLVSQKTKLQVYFSLNFFVVLIASFVSFKAVLFYSTYIFLIWFYSHKIKKYAIIGNLMAAFLAVLPFFGILWYYYLRLPLDVIENNSTELEVVISHGVFLLLLILIREMIKDLENLQGDFANDYKTIPIIYGEKMSKRIITGLTLLTIVPVYFLINIYDVGYMDIYFYFSFIVLIFFLLYLWKWQTKAQYVMLHNLLKFLIVAGVFSIILINPSVLWNGKKILMTI